MEIVKTMVSAGLFLMETMVNGVVISHVLNKIGFSYFLSVPLIGRK